MTTWVVGDIQGCFEPFECLLKAVQFNPNQDTLWSVGDLINRGSDNLSTLRWFYQHRRAVNVVLGNHDLHLLATRTGAGRMSKSDNFEDVLNAPDGNELMDWLQEQPLLHQFEDNLFVHAGIPPCWSSKDAKGYAREVEQALQSETSGQFFSTMYGNEPCRWSPYLTGLTRLRVITNYLTRMRYCTKSGALDLKSKGPKPKDLDFAGEQLKPWFKHPHQLIPNERVFFGHWAALEGKTRSKRFIGLDTGCVWGGHMTLHNLETGENFTCDCDNQSAKR